MCRTCSLEVCTDMPVLKALPQPSMDHHSALYIHHQPPQHTTTAPFHHRINLLPPPYKHRQLTTTYHKLLWICLYWYCDDASGRYWAHGPPASSATATTRDSELLLLHHKITDQISRMQNAFSLATLPAPGQCGLTGRRLGRDDHGSSLCSYFDGTPQGSPLHTLSESSAN